MSDENQLCEMSEEQQNPYLCDSRDWKVEEQLEGGGQCGESKAQYHKLLRQGEIGANASFFTEAAEQHPDANHAAKSNTP